MSLFSPIVAFDDIVCFGPIPAELQSIPSHFFNGRGPMNSLTELCRLSTHVNLYNRLECNPQDGKLRIGRAPEAGEVFFTGDALLEYCRANCICEDSWRRFERDMARNPVLTILLHRWKERGLGDDDSCKDLWWYGDAFYGVGVKRCIEIVNNIFRRKTTSSARLDGLNRYVERREGRRRSDVDTALGIGVNSFDRLGSLNSG
ncbi:MAG: hypothetical protein M1824_004779 [Vezdaea acicularis]|nr:MAG: hypothetical protein M1824_004779 [Vezdaea acicularis]